MDAKVDEQPLTNIDPSIEDLYDGLSRLLDAGELGYRHL
jgi:hypothetical protein